MFDRIGIVCPGGSLMGASVIRLRSGTGCSASNRRNAPATRSRSVEPRWTPWAGACYWRARPMVLGIRRPAAAERTTGGDRRMLCSLWPGSFCRARSLLKRVATLHRVLDFG
jgi:hypothetical protein